MSEIESDEDLVEIDVDSIKVTLKRSKNTAAGEELQELADIYNGSLRAGEVPDDWLHSFLAVLSKPGENHSILGGYRIITMPNTSGKLLEKIVARYIAQDLEARGDLPAILGSYRQGKDTWAHAAIFAYDT